MYWQSEYLREGVTMARGQTYRIDLPESGLLSSLILKLSAPSVSGLGLTGGNWRLLDFLGNLEIVGNGATVIKSLPFKSAHYLAWLSQGVVPPHFWRNYATNTQMEYLCLNFGRMLKDPQYGLDLGQWDNVEFRLTNTSSASYHGADISLSILQVFMRESPGGFSGHIRSELFREWTTVSDETKYLILPSEFPIRGVHLQSVPETSSGMSETNFANQMDDIDFSIQGGTKRLYKGGLDDLVVLHHFEAGNEVLTSGQADVNADAGIDYGIGRGFGWSGISGSKDGAVSAVIPTAIADPTDNTISFEAREADSPIMFMARGMGYLNHVALLHSPELKPDEMLDPRQTGEIRLNIHTRSGAGYAGGTNRVILERLVI